MYKSSINSNSQINIYCDGGFANRINCLVNGIVLARKFNIHYRVYWPTNRYCEIELNEIIDVTFPVFNKGKSAIKDLGVIGIVADDNFISAQNEYWINPRKSNTYDFTSSGVLKIFELVDVLVIFFPLPIYEFRTDFRSILFEIFGSRISSLVKLDNEIKQLGLYYPYWGLHMRGTDARKSTGYYIFFRILVSFLPGQVYLATDDLDLRNFFSNLSNILYRKEGTTVLKASVSSDWNFKSLDENGELMPYNVHRTRENVMDAIVELLLLSRSRLIPTSSSTYLELAANISVKKFSLVRIIFYCKYLVRVLINRYQ